MSQLNPSQVKERISTVLSLDDLKVFLSSLELGSLSFICQSLGLSGRGDRQQLTASIITWWNKNRKT